MKMRRTLPDTPRALNASSRLPARSRGTGTGTKTVSLPPGAQCKTLHMRAAAWLPDTPRALNASSRLAVRSRGTGEYKRSSVFLVDSR